MTKPIKPWFAIDGQPGHSLEQQLTGLGRLLATVPGKSMLDCGCAEGLISIEMARCGAAPVVGIELLASFVEEARRAARDATAAPVFVNADLNTYRPATTFNVVTALAVLQKLRDPCAVASWMADVATELIVIRTPMRPDPWVLPPERQRTVPHDIGAVLRGRGWRLSEQTVGAFGGAVGYWERA